MDLTFHAAVLASIAAGALAVRRGFTAWPAALAIAVCLAAVFSIALAEDTFHVMRHAAWLLFAYLPSGLLAVSVVLRRDRPRVSLGVAAGALLLLAVALDAFLIEPGSLEVTRYEIESDLVPQRLRIVVFADLQSDEIGDFERRALETGMAETPDLVLLPGDYVQAPAERREAEWKALGRLVRAVPVAAPLGAFAVEGNVDAAGWPDLFRKTDVTPLDRTKTLHLESWLTLTALSFGDSFDPRLAVGGTDGFDVVLGHGPDFALGNSDAELQIAGHTHGGQVRLPLIGPLLTLSRVPRAWASGMTLLPSGGRLVVSRGIGMERGRAPRLRFLCRPEVVVIDVVPSRGSSGSPGASESQHLER